MSIKAEQKGRNNLNLEYLENPHRHRRNTHSSHRPNEPLRHAPLLTLLLFFRSHTSETDALIIGSCWNSLECCHICFGYTQEITTARAFSVLKWEVLEVAGRPRLMQTVRTDKATHAKEGWATQRGRGEPSTEIQKDPPEFNSWTLMCVFSLIQSRSAGFLLRSVGFQTYSLASWERRGAATILSCQNVPSLWSMINQMEPKAIINDNNI